MKPAPRPRKPRAKKPRAPGAKPAGRARLLSWARYGLLASLGLSIALVALVGHYFLSPHAGSGRTVRVSFSPGADAAEVTRALWQGGLIDRPYIFHALMVLTRARARTRSLRFRDDLSPRVILRALLNGSAGLVRVTLPEGYNRFEIARRIHDAGVCPYEDFVRETEDPEIAAHMGFAGVASLEGYLYPETYDFGLESPCTRVIERMTREFTRRYDELVGRHPEALVRARALPFEGDPRVVLVTLASLVEKETGSAEDRAHVASVFWNRLNFMDFRPHLLQTDPSVTYGCLVSRAPSCRPDGGSPSAITSAMLNDAQNPYNTYRVENLPPGPIANPGARCLEAVMSPTHDRDLYFVAMPGGRSAFAPTLAEHTRNVRRYLRPATPMPDGGRASP